MITDINQLDFDKYYTYTDYLTWKFSERVELIKGKILKMSPAPSRRHQEVSWNLVRHIGNYLEGKSCKAFHAPFDVRLPISLKKGKADTIVQPDICVVCDLKLLDDQGCNGVPDLVVEVLSPGNTKREMRDKFKLYQEAGVKEYWLVHPTEEYVVIHQLNKKGTYVSSPYYVEDDKLKSSVLKGFKLATQQIFQ